MFFSYPRLTRGLLMEPEAFKAPRLLLLYHNVLRHFFIDSHSGIFNMDDHVSAKLRDHPNLASIHKTKVCQEPSCISRLR